MNPHPDFPAITLAAIEAELRREETARRNLYGRKVDAGNMLREEAEHGLAIVAAWLEDVQRIAAHRAGASARWQAFLAGRRPDFTPPAPAHGVAWADRRRALRRELALRDRHYPQWIAAGRLLERDAQQRTACLECLLALYEDGWDWRGSDGALPGESGLAAREFAELTAERFARDGTAQTELAI